MQNGHSITQLVDDRHPRSSPNTQLAAALTALGIPLDPHVGAQHFREKVAPSNIKDTTVWTFAERSACGKYDSAEMVRCWHDEAWMKANPEHPLAYLRAAFRNRDKLLDYICDVQGPLAVKRRGERAVVISKHTTAEARERLLKRLNA